MEVTLGQGLSLVAVQHGLTGQGSAAVQSAAGLCVIKVPVVRPAVYDGIQGPVSI